LAPITLVIRAVLWCMGFWRIDIIDRRSHGHGFDTPTPSMVVVAALDVG